MDVLDGFSLLLVDDHPLFRDGLRAALLHQAPGLRVEALGSANEALVTIAHDPDRFDLVLFDYLLPGMDGMRCASELIEQHPALGVGLMSGVDDPTLARRARHAGLVAYIPKSLEIPALLSLLRRLAQGDPALSDAPDGPHTEANPAAVGPFGLTARQTAVLRLLASGGSNKEIARHMGISPGTVKNHLNAIFSKLGATNRLQAVMMARDALRDDAG